MSISFNDLQVEVDSILLNGKFCTSLSKINEIQNSFKRKDLSDKEASEILGRQWRKCLERMRKLYRFLCSGKYYCKGMPVEITTNFYGQIGFKTAKTITNIIRDMKAIDACKVFSNKYSVADHMAKHFVLNHELLDILFEVKNITCEEEINIINVIDKDKDIINNDNNINDNDDNNDDDDDDELRVQPPSWIVEDVKKTLAKQNFTNYDRKFIYSYTKENSGRVYASFCSIPTREKHMKQNHDIYREDILVKEFPNGYFHWDRNASIHNLNYSLLTGKIRENDRHVYDFYEDFMGKRLTEEERNSIKLLVMTLYFSNVRKWRSTVNSVWLFYIEHTDNIYDVKRALKGKERVEAAWKLIGIDKTFKTKKEFVDCFAEWFKETQEKLKVAEGGSFIGKPIFQYEAFVNLETQIALQNLGYKTVTVYDGFYTTAPEDLWWKIYKLKVYELIEIFQKH